MHVYRGGRSIKEALIAAALGLLLSLALIHADANPYAAIAARNVFNLKDPPAPVLVAPTPPPRPTPNLALSGLVDFSTHKWAFISRADPGKPAKSYTLTPGETEAGLHLVAINAKSATATVVVDGMETVTLTLTAPTNRPPTKATQVNQFSATRPRIPQRVPR